MEEAIDTYGSAALDIIGAIGAFAIFLGCISSNGVLYIAVLNFMKSICG